MLEIIKDLLLMAFVVLATVGIAIVFGWATRHFGKSGGQRKDDKPKSRRW